MKGGMARFIESLVLTFFFRRLWRITMARRRSESGDACTDIEMRVHEALVELGLSNVMSLSHKRIYEQWVFVLKAPVDLSVYGM